MKKTNGKTAFRNEAIKLLKEAARLIESWQAQHVELNSPVASKIRRFIIKSLPRPGGRRKIMRTCPGPGCMAGPMDTRQWRSHILKCKYLKEAANVSGNAATAPVA